MGRKLRHIAFALAAAGALVAGASAPAHAVSVTFTGMIDSFATDLFGTNIFGINNRSFVSGSASYTAATPGGEVYFSDPSFGFNLVLDPAPVGRPLTPPAALRFSAAEDYNFLTGSPLNPFLSFDELGALGGIDTLVYFNYNPFLVPFGDRVRDPSRAFFEFSMVGQNFQINALEGGNFQRNLITGHFDFSTVVVSEVPPGNPVPEPGSLLLLGSGLLGLAGVARRRGRQR